MGLVTAGLMNKQIAGELGVSEITVKVHRGNVMRKMNARSLADLVRMADAWGAPRAALNRRATIRNIVPYPQSILKACGSTVALLRRRILKRVL